MLIETLEQTLTTARKYQTETNIRLMQKEQELRSTLATYIDESLTLLGKGVVWGRKLSESFAAQTHRRAEKLKKIEEAFDAGSFEADESEEATEAEPETVKAEAHATPEPDFHQNQKQMKKLNRKSAAKKTKMRDTRIRAHSNASRSH